MILEETESKTSLRSHYSGNFRSGLKFPSVENKLSPHDIGNSSNPQRDSGKKKISAPGTGQNVKLVPHASASDHAIPSFKLKRNQVGKLSGRGRKAGINRRMLDAEGGGDTVSTDIKNPLKSSSHELSPPPSQQFSLDTSPSRDNRKKPEVKVKKSKNKDIDNEINQRISSVYRSIETLAKKRINFDNSIRAATRRTVADGAKNKSILTAVAAATASPGPESDGGEREPESSGRRKNSKIIDVTRTYPKMFGLDPMKVIASSEDDSDIDENGSRDPRKKTKKSIRKYLEQLVRDEQPRDMSAIMPTLSEKTFLTKLQKRESQLNKEINDMRNNLDVMNMRAEREARKAQVERKKHSNYPNSKPTVTRLATMAEPNNKGPARELSDFLQATGGSTGGWEQDDHQVFIHAFQKWSNNPIKFVEHLTKLLPKNNLDKRPEDIVDHRNWYEKFEKLNNVNRDHIRQWQASKKQERQLAYQMAAESQNARKQVEKRQQELIKIRRNAEREKNKELLEEWKRSRSLLCKKASLGDLGNGERIAQMDLEMSNIRKEIHEITSMTRDIGKGLQSVQVKETNTVRKRGGRARTAQSDASSGFCEMSMEEIEALGKELAGDGEKFLRKNLRNGTARSQPHESTLKKSEGIPKDKKKLLEDFRTRDDELVQAKKKAIMRRKEKMRNRAFLTDEEVKERMKKISTPSKFMTPTKGWMIRREIRELEKVESLNKIENPSDHDIKESFKPPTFVNNIPKLGIPSWKKSAA